VQEVAVGQLVAGRVDSLEQQPPQTLRELLEEEDVLAESTRRRERGKR
jgi:hypothetical protein